MRALLSLGVFDEAVYGVKPDTTTDPLRFFYRREYSRVATMFSRDYGFVGYSGTQRLLLAQRRRPLGLADFKASRPERPDVRRDFPDAIFWAPGLVTDANGEATVKVAYPDALTAWRATVRATKTDTRVGTGVGRSTVTKDLIVRAITPRFLTEGDVLQLPVIVHNYLPEAQRRQTQHPLERCWLGTAVHWDETPARALRRFEGQTTWIYPCCWL